MENSPTYAGTVDIQKQLPQYEKDLARCVPRNKHSPVLEEELDRCVEQANKHDDLKNKLDNLGKDQEYIATLKKADTLQSNAEYSRSLSLLLAIPLIIGTIAYTRRRKEEFLEKNPEYLNRLEELQKSIKR